MLKLTHSNTPKGLKEGYCNKLPAKDGNCNRKLESEENKMNHQPVMKRRQVIKSNRRYANLQEKLQREWEVSQVFDRNRILAIAQKTGLPSTKVYKFYWDLQNNMKKT
jgi:hypothetical protein